MAQVRAIFRECIQDSQEYGSNDEFMVSRVWVGIEVDGEDRGEYIADLKQTVGSDYETGAIEVGLPVEVGSGGKKYSGPFSYDDFRRAAEQYFRQLVGPNARGIRLGGKGKVRMQGNRFVMQSVAEFEAADVPPGRW